MHIRTGRANDSVRVSAHGQHLLQLGRVGNGARVATLVLFASTASAQSVSNDFDMQFPNGNDTSLVSGVESFL
jgi:hypothetical protein